MMPSETQSKNISDILQKLQALTRTRRLDTERANLSWFGEIETVGLDAYMYPDDDESGRQRIAGFDQTGRRVVGTARYSDSQSDNPSPVSFSEPLGAGSHCSHDLPAEQIAPNTSSSVQDRILALQEWVVGDQDSAAGFILDQLSTKQTDDEWLSAIVYAAEDVRFSEERQLQQAARSLYAIAHDLRNRCDSSIEPVAYSAIRRFASLIAEKDANELTTFLNQSGNVDTRLVAIQCVNYIFESGPPEKSTSLKALQDRLVELASKFLDSDVLVPGETSAIAEQLVSAVAATSDDRLESIVERVKSLNVEWFTAIVRRNLGQLIDAWMSRNPNLREHPTGQRIAHVLAGWTN